MSKDNVDLIRRGYEAFARRDFAAVFDLLHPDIEIFQTDLLPWGGTYRGHQEAQDFFRKLGEHVVGQPEPENFIAAGDDVMAVGRLRGKVLANGRQFDLSFVHLWTFKEDQVIVFSAYIDTPGMLSALGTD